MRIKVSFEIDIHDATDKDVSDWLNYELNANGGLSIENPLSEIEMEALPWSVEWKKL